MNIVTDMRIKYLQGNKKGQVEEVSRNVAFGLIDSGKAILTKDMIPDDYKATGQKQAGVKNGKST